MKYSIVCFAVAVYSANAFSVQPQQQARKDVMSLGATASDGKSNPAGWIAATAFAGWTLVSAPMALALVPPVDNILPDSPTMLVAGGAYQPEEGYDSTSLSLPSYNVNNDDLLVGKAADKQKEPKEQKVKAAPKVKAPPKNETAEKKAAREAKEARAAEKAAEREVEAQAKKAKEVERLQRDLEKIAAKKAEKAAAQAKRVR